MKFRYFSQRVRALRKSMKGISQVRLAEVVGAGQSTIQAWEAGKSSPNIAQLIDLANCFRLGTVDELIRSVPPGSKSRVVPQDVLLEIAHDANAILANAQKLLQEPKPAKHKPNPKAKKKDLST